jgi:inorganic pyrophosphatase
MARSVPLRDTATGQRMVDLPESDPTELPWRKGGLVVVVVETPSGSGNKFKFDPELGTYRLDRTLPPGLRFPFDFGFIPQTKADDGDPLDAIVLLDSPVYPGCVVLARVIGVIEAEQQDGGVGPWERNDRVVAVAGGPKGHASVHSLSDLDPFRLRAIESFFADYHRPDGDRFRVIGHGRSRAAGQAIRRAHETFLAERAIARQPRSRGGSIPARGSRRSTAA